MAEIELAKDAIDVGVMTNHWPDHGSAFEELGIAYDHLLKIGGGIHQHRFFGDTSVLKVNSHRAPLRQEASTLHTIEIVADVEARRAWESPDGVRFVAVPRDKGSLETIQVGWRTSLVDDVAMFLADAFGAKPGPGDLTLEIGRSRIALETANEAVTIGELNAVGVRYLTVQVHNVEHAHHYVLGVGASEGSPPRRMGDTAYISFVRAPDGTWIELSQRASLTGPLPD